MRAKCGLIKNVLCTWCQANSEHSKSLNCYLLNVYRLTMPSYRDRRLGKVRLLMSTIICSRRRLPKVEGVIDFVIVLALTVLFEDLSDQFEDQFARVLLV